MVRAETYEQVALEEPDQFWELDNGCLRKKPEMTAFHNDVMFTLVAVLMRSLDRRRYRVRANSGRTRSLSATYYIPDVFVVPRDLVERAKRERPLALEWYAEPLPLGVEVWSPSTGGYDVDAKLPESQRRGDLEIWRVHPSERTLTAWVRQADGSYVETVYRGGRIVAAHLPGVAFELAELFD